MPGKVKVKIISGKNLPIMDRSNETTDAYVEIKLGNITYKTEVCRRTLHPRWNTDWYRFELDDSELQDEPLQIRLMDHDTYSANDAIGKVYLNLNPLLLPAAGQLALGDNNPHHEISGWIPVYDTMHGIRGEVNVTVKVELFSDFNKFRQSSCGIKFFYSQCIPQGYQVKVINGFVEELIVDDDPEYQWIDKIRTPRASNEARQTLFFKLSGELQRKIGVKAVNLGGNAVIGYKQCFDLEGESGIVARGIGTSVILIKAVPLPNPLIESREEDAEKYLKFVGEGKRFSLSLPVHSNFRLKLFPIPLSVSPPLTKRIPKKLSQRLYSSLDSGNISSISSPSVFQDDSTLKVLLSQEDKRGKSAMSRRFQKFKHSQKSLTKKMTALRAKLADSIGEETEPTTTGKRSKFKRAASDSGAMAEFLARSVIQATNSLSCILEAGAPAKVDDTMKSLQPLSNLLSKTESRSSVQDNFSDGSDSTSESTSSGSEYDDSEKTMNDEDTISNIVSNVEKLQRRLSKDNLKKQQSLPSISLRGLSTESLDTISEIDDKNNQPDKCQQESLSKIKDSSYLGKHNVSKLMLELNKKMENVEGSRKKKALLIETSFGCRSANEEYFTKSNNLPSSEEKIDSLKKSYFSEFPRDHSNFRNVDLATSSDNLFDLDSTKNMENPDNLLIAPIENINPRETHLVKSALQTMLVDRLNYLDVATPQILPFHESLPHVPSKNIENKPLSISKNKTESETLGMVNSSLSVEAENSSSGENNLVQSAVKTMLLERLNFMNVATPPTTPNVKKSHEGSFMFEESVDKNINQHQLVESALKTILIDKLNTTRATLPHVPLKITKNSVMETEMRLEGNPRQATPAEIVAPIITDSIEKSDKHLFTSAMETMLIDKLNCLEIDTPLASPKLVSDIVNRRKYCNLLNDNIKIQKLTPENVTTDSKHLVETAVQTILLDDFNAVGTPVFADLSNNNQNSDHENVKTLQSNLVKNSKFKICDYPDPQKESEISDLKELNKTGFRDDQETSSMTKDIYEKIIENSAIFMKAQKEIKKSVPPVSTEELVKEICEKVMENSAIFTKTDKNEYINELIAPIDSEGFKAKPKQIVKTAMQLILLEKLNTMGASTPPASPIILNNTKTFHLPENFVDEKEGDINYLNLLSETKPQKRSIPKSFSSINFTTYSKPDELDFNDKSDTFSCFSDTDLHEPITEKQVLKKKKKFGFFKLKFNKERMNNSFKFLRHKEESESSQTTEPHQNILSKMFHPKHADKSLKDTETQTSTEFLIDITTPALSASSNTNSGISKIQPLYPGNTEHEPGLSHPPSITNSACITSNRQNSSPVHQETNGHGSSQQKKDGSPDRMPGKHSYSPIKLNASALLHRRSSDSDLSITPKGNSLTGSDRSGGHTASMHMKNHYVRRNGPQDNFEMMEYPFLTMNNFPSSFVIHLGSSVSSKSVKVLERISNIDEPESRDSWWSEIRTEIRAHARSLNCNAVLGYSESASIYEDVCVLSASGTAALVDFNNLGFATDEDNVITQRNYDRDGAKKTIYESPEHNSNKATSCRISHLPYDDQNVPANAKVLKCPMCSKGRVPEVHIVTIEPLDNLPNVGKGCFIECHVSRPLKDCRGESIAREISDGLPFLEYELHRLLVNKLKIKGMNAIFSLKIRYSMGEKMLIAIASGTAMYLTSLHAPTLPVLVSDRVSDEKIVAGLQEMLIETIKKNREIYEIKDDAHNKLTEDEAEDGKATLDLAFGNKDCSILEMDDPEDADVVSLLMEDKVPDGFHVVNTESVPGLNDLEIVKNLQMFIQIYRAKISPNHNLQKHFQRLLQSVYFKLRRMVPCALCDLQFRVDIPDSDEIQLCIIGMALGLGKKVVKRTPVPTKKNEDDLIFKLDEDTPQDTPIHGLRSNSTSLKHRPGRSPLKLRNSSVKQRHIPHKERHGVDITPLSYVPGGNIEQYLGNLNFFFIRETTSIREEGGLSGLIHSFITEVLAIVRSHVSALGGNALVAFFMTECVLNHNLHKNQGQCLINVGGDVVSVSYQEDA